MKVGEDPPPPAWISAIPEEARKYQGRQAGLVSRTLANLVDTGVLALFLGALYLTVSGVLFAVDPVGFGFPAPSRGLVLTVGAGITVGYLAVCWTVTGRTFGDQLLGLRVLGRRGRKLRFDAATLRAVAYLVFPVGLLWVVVGTSRRSVQDVLLRTSVVYDWNPHSRSDGV